MLSNSHGDLATGFANVDKLTIFAVQSIDSISFVSKNTVFFAPKDVSEGERANDARGKEEQSF